MELSRRAQYLPRMVVLDGSVLHRFRAFSLYNSPYPAHAEGDAIDLYPEDAAPAPSPVAGEVVGTRTVRAPPKPYAADHDHVIVVDTGPRLARLLHVDPAVEPGDVVEVGDPLGSLVRSGYFAPWVDNHVHVGFREQGADPYRASGSLPLAVDVPITPVPWDGTGTVVERTRTYVVLDRPGHPAPGTRFAGLDGGGGVLDGGLPHYPGGGLFPDGDGTATILGEPVGSAAGRTVTWDDVEVRVNGAGVTGLSLACHRDRLGAKLVSWDGIPVEVGSEVDVTVHRC